MTQPTITPDVLDSEYAGDHEYAALEHDTQQSLLKDAVDDFFKWEPLIEEVVEVAQNHPAGDAYTVDDSEELASTLVFEWFDEHLDGFEMQFELPIVRKYESEAMSRARAAHKNRVQD